MTDGPQKRNLEELLAQLLETTYRLEQRIAHLEGQQSSPSPPLASQPSAPVVRPPQFHPPASLQPPSEPLVGAPPAVLPPTPPPPLPAAENAQPVPLAPANAEIAELLTEFNRGPSKPVPPPAGTYANPTPPVPTKQSWEVRIGTYWLPRIAVFFLALAIVLAARQYFQGPWGKIFLGYGLSLGLIIAGLIKETKYPMWARPVLAAGLTFSYFTTYAIGFIEPMQVVESLAVKIGLLAINVGAILAIAQWKRSEAIAGMALVLGYLTTGLTGTGTPALAATLGLSIVALLFILVNRWVHSAAVAAIATYAAHFYVFKFVDPAGTQVEKVVGPHGIFLLCYFVVFHVAALLGLRRDNAPRGDALAGSWTSRSLQALVQINLAAFFASVCHVYWDAGLWHRVDVFLFAYAAVVFGLSLLFRARPAVQGSHLVAASVALAFGIIASVTPYWMAILLGAQAIGMLRMARYGFPRLWVALSLLALSYATIYLVFESHHRIDTSIITFAGFAAILLVYTWAWPRWVSHAIQHALRGLEYLFSVAAALILALGTSVHIDPAHAATFLLTAAASVSALAVLTALPLFLAFTITAAVVVWPACFHHELQDQPLYHLVVGMACLTAGYAVEKLLTRGTLERYSWRFLYGWAVLLLILTIPGHLLDTAPLIGLLTLAVAGGGVALRSAALVKMAIVPGFLAITGMVSSANIDTVGQVIAYSFVLIAALVIATPKWYPRTGEWRPDVASWLQFLLVLGGSIGLWIKLMNQTAYDITLLAGLGAVAAALGAWFSRLKLYLVAALMLVAAGMLAIGIIGQGSWTFSRTVVSIDGLIAAFLMVAIERALAWRSRATGESTLHQARLLRGFRSVLAVVSLIFAVIMIQFHPSIQVFYFTGALVGLAFIWMVFGFWFGESSYRQAGFGALCLGILKGLVWDVLSLKEPIYRIASWAALGVIAIAASFLYNRYREKLNKANEQ